MHIICNAGVPGAQEGGCLHSVAPPARGSLCLGGQRWKRALLARRWVMSVWDYLPIIQLLSLFIHLHYFLVLSGTSVGDDSYDFFIIISL